MNQVFRTPQTSSFPDAGEDVAGESRFTALRRLITSADLSFLMEAHSGLSAKIVQEAGFRGVWASGLTISASLGLRDSNEASWTQVMDVLEYMSDATDLPILVDGDTGHGNFNNVRRFVRKLCERGVAGVCIEDKLFPKTNSFIGEEQPLADVEEFCGRIKAGKDSQTHDDFTLVARVEALISGRGMEEALRRAEAYHAAGADAVLIHSKKAEAGEIFGFMERWGNRAPVVIVPTMYYATPTELFRQAGVSTIIWANHLLRSSMSAMGETARRIHEDQSLIEVEGRVSSVKDIFRLVGNAELEDAERRYLPEKPAARAIVLGAAKGELGETTKDQPKCMADIRGESLLQRLVTTFKDSGARDVSVVRGYRKEAVALKGVGLVDNDRYAETGEAYSLSLALDGNSVDAETVVAYGDVLFRRYILDSLMTSSADIAIAVDALNLHRSELGSAHLAQKRDLVAADHAYSGDYLDDAPAKLTAMSHAEPTGDLAAVQGEWMGLARFSPTGSQWLREEIEALRTEGALDTADMPMLLTRLAQKHPVRVKYFTGHWMNINTLQDLADARNFQ